MALAWIQPDRTQRSVLRHAGIKPVRSQEAVRGPAREVRQSHRLAIADRTGSGTRSGRQNGRDFRLGASALPSLQSEHRIRRIASAATAAHAFPGRRRAVRRKLCIELFQAIDSRQAASGACEPRSDSATKPGRQVCERYLQHSIGQSPPYLGPHGLHERGPRSHRVSPPAGML